ncbi:tetraspanin-3-like [Dreissena polymorpha]|uniref:Tetraspanin n=1 Tax=Dreissena polymorpha TaxID=45954 RepID=A0A9D4BF42_DREPO|nr:tetraspanin-3-like [Dreissena polymorpha]KAH3692403.1 hypothetical protein DPMN_194853 [Dreissena polymorpha]
MGISKCGRVFLVTVNIFFVILGIIFFGGGMFLRFGKKYTEQYTQSAENSLEKLITDLTGDNSGIDLDMDKLLLSVSMILIFIGLFLLIIALLGCIGACCKIKCIVTIYLLICLVILIVEVVCVILLYGTKTLQGTIKSTLKSEITRSYAGLSGSDITSLAMNIINIQGKCCGIDNYKDFHTATKWNKQEKITSGQLSVETPFTCCITLPSSSSETGCATSPTDLNNYMNVGCFDKLWKGSLGKLVYALGVLGGIGALQLLLIISALCVLCGKDKNKVGNYDGGGGDHRKNQVVPSIPGMKKGARRY